MSGNESYLDIVWRQFRKNRPAYWALWGMAPLFQVAIFAPVLASNVPFVFYDHDTTIYPWFRALFNPDQPADFFFNMALVASAPTLVLGLLTSFVGLLRGWSGRQRLAAVAVEYAVLTLAVCALFAQQPPRGLRPAHSYYARSFGEEQFQSPQEKHGIYAPIPFGPIGGDLAVRFQAPGFSKPVESYSDVNDGFVHWLGTDKTGRDVLTLMIYGTRLAMTVGFVAVGLYVTIGVILGALAGYFGGAIDMLISRLIEVMLLFPAFFLILTIVGLKGPSIYIIMVVIGVTGWPGIARLIRGEVLKQRSIDYTAAAQALGSSHLRIVFRHILPNAMSPALVAAPFGIASAILTEASLSLLGFGVRPPAPSWGTMLHQAYGNYDCWWLIVFPSIGIFVTVTFFNLVGAGLRDAMDPKLRI